MDQLLNDLENAENDLALSSFHWGSLSSIVDPVQSKAAFEQVEIYRKKCKEKRNEIMEVFKKRTSGYPYDVLARIQEEVARNNAAGGKSLERVKKDAFSGYPNLNNEGLFD